MAEPPSKRFRFDARSAASAAAPSNASRMRMPATVTAGGPSSSHIGSGGGNHYNNNNNKAASNANKNSNDNDPWGDDIVFDEDFEREFQEICSQNISTVVDLNRRSSHPSQHPPVLPSHPAQQQQQQQQVHPPQQLHHQQQQRHQQSSAVVGVPVSPTIRRSVSNQAASGVSYAASAATAAVGPSTAAALARPAAASTSSSQYYNFQPRRQPPPTHAPAAPTPTPSGTVLRYSSGSVAVSTSTQRKPSGSDAIAELRDRLHTVQGQYVALNESLETVKQTLANERVARQKAELDVKKLETERAFNAKEIETLLSENQSLSIRLRKREEQQQQTQMQFTQLMNRDVIPATQVMVQHQQQQFQQQFPSMASFCSRSPVSGPSPLGLRSPHTPLRPQPHQLHLQQQPPPPAPLPSGSPTASVTSTEDMDYDDNEEIAASMSATPGGDSDESDSWPVAAKQPESAGWHRRRAELLALYPGLLAQCSTADRAIRCLNQPQQFQHQRQLPSDILDDMPATAWSADARREVTDALDCLAKLTTRELELTLTESSACGPGEAERLLPPIRSRLSGYLLAVRLRGVSSAVCARQLALAFDTGADDFAGSDSNLAADLSNRRLTPTTDQLANLGLDALQQLWRLCQLSGEAALGLLRNVGRRETALVADLFELVRLLPGDQISACDTEALHCSLQVLHYLLLRLPENRRHQLVEFFCTGLEPAARERLVRSRYRPTVTLYVKIIMVVHSGLDGYANLAAHNDPCRIAELAQCLELRPSTGPEPELLHLIDALNCLIRECIAMERLHKSTTGIALLNRNCQDRCFYKLICALSNALAQLMPLHYCSSASVNPGLVSSIHSYIRTTDALKDYLDVQSCKEIVRQDKTHYFIISVVECFKDLLGDNKYQEREYVAPSRPSLDAQLLNL